MKKFILIFGTALASLQLQAQNINPEGDNVTRVPKYVKQKKSFTADSLLSSWCIDLNLSAGLLSQQY